jgi:DNA repair protein RadC
VAKPSETDILITKQIVEAGKILGISLLGHVIVTKNKFESVPVEYR